MVHYAPFEQSQHNVVIYFDVHSLCSLYYVEYLVCTSILLVLNKFTCPFKKKKKKFFFFLFFYYKKKKKKKKKNNKNNNKMLKKIIKENSTIFSFEDLPPDVP